MPVEPAGSGRAGALQSVLTVYHPVGSAVGCSGSVAAAAKSKDFMAAPTGEDNLTNDEDSDGDGGGEVQLKRAGRAKAKAEAARVAEWEEEEKKSGGGEGGAGG